MNELAILGKERGDFIACEVGEVGEVYSPPGQEVLVFVGEFIFVYLGKAGKGWATCR